MKKQLILSTLALSLGGVAMAQDAVTVYGAMDAGINRVTFGAKSATKISEGGITASQLGFRGSEDMGGGNRAIFDIQGGISIDSGTGNIGATPTSTEFAFTRQAFVGLEANWGTLTAGRQYTPTFSFVASFDPFGANALFSSANLWFNPLDQPGYVGLVVRQNNSLKYSSPAALPVQVSAMVGYGEAASNSSGNMFDFSVRYAQGPIWASFARQERKSGTGAAPVASPTTSTSQGFAATYNFGVAKLGFNMGTGKSNAVGSQSAKYAGLMGQIDLGSWQFLGILQKRDVSNTANDQKAYTLGANYVLSKRTSLYVRVLNWRNEGTATVALGGYTFTGITPVAGDDGRSLMLGVRHTF